MKEASSLGAFFLVANLVAASRQRKEKRPRLRKALILGGTSKA
jgi:hypothetical protein